MFARIAVATLTVLSPALALHLNALAEDASDAGKFAYVITWMKPSEVPRNTDAKLIVDVAEAQEDDKSQFALKGKVEEEDMRKTEVDELVDGALPPNGAKKMIENGPDFIFRIDDQLRAAGAKYPLVVMTNDPQMLGHPALSKHPNMKTLRIGTDVELLVLKGGQIQPRNKMHAQKLTVFSLTQFDKVVSLDMDVTVKGNPDHIFTDFDTKNGQQVYGMWNDFSCNNHPHMVNDYFNSAIMLLEPNKAIFKELLEFARTNHGFWGEQIIVQSFFKNHIKNAPQALPFKVADFVDCKQRMSKNSPDVVHRR